MSSQVRDSKLPGSTVPSTQQTNPNGRTLGGSDSDESQGMGRRAGSGTASVRLVKRWEGCALAQAPSVCLPPRCALTRVQACDCACMHTHPVYMVLCLLVGDGNTPVWGPRGVLRVARLGPQRDEHAWCTRGQLTWATHGWGSAEAPDQTLAAVPTTPPSPHRPHSNVPNPKGGPNRDPLQADTRTTSAEAPPMLETEGLPMVSPAQTEAPAELRGRRALTRKLG